TARVSTTSAVPGDRVQDVGAVEALQLGLPGLTEHQVPAGLDDLPHQGGHEDLPAPGLTGDAGGQHDRVAEKGAVLDDRLAGVHADPHPQQVGGPRSTVGVHRALDVDGAEDGGAGAREGQHEAVALGLDLAAPAALEVAPHD